MAIEKDGRIGLQRQPSGDSTLSGRKLSGDTEATSSILQDSARTNVSSPDTSRSDLRGPGGPGVSPPRSSFTEAAGTPPFAGRIAGPPIPTDPLAGASPRGPGTSTSTAAAASGGKPNLQEGLAASPQIRQAPRWRPAEGASGGSSSLGKAAKEGEAQAVPDQNEAQEEGSKHTVSLGGAKRKDTSGGSGGEPAAGGASQVAAALNGADKTKASKPAATSVGSSTPSSQKKKPAGKASEPTSKPATTPPPAGKPAAEKKKTPSTVSPGFVKPRPKSPTRPIELPSRLTQPTAAAAAKNKNAPPPALTTYRPASRTATSGKGLGRSASVTSRQRPSVGPPPKQVAKDYPVPKREAKVDEGFLARMMRPTQASASKVAEKVTLPTTPPRKAANATNKKSTSAKSGPTRRVVSKTHSTTNSAAATPETKKEVSSSAKKVERVPIAEEAITIPKRSAGNAPRKISEETVAAPTVKKAGASESSEIGIPKASEKDDVSNTNEEKDTSKPSESQEDAADGYEDKENQNGLSEPSEKVQPALKSPEKASDAMFAAFMNPGTQNTEAPQTNGNHAEGESGKGSEALDEIKSEQTDKEPSINGASGAAEAQYDEQETW